MIIFKYATQFDYGKNYYLTLFSGKIWTLFQFHFSVLRYGTKYPYISIIIGSGKLFKLVFQFRTIAFIIEFVSKKWI
jgi:hypothetical protein